MYSCVQGEDVCMCVTVHVWQSDDNAFSVSCFCNSTVYSRLADLRASGALSSCLGNAGIADAP